MPSSHVGMPNFIGVLGVPDLGTRRRPVWFESFNELHHLLDLIIESGAEAVLAQPFRLEWRFGSQGIRQHYPDILVDLPGGARVLVDVTTTAKVPASKPMMAMARLSAETCRLLGWGYQLRTELPPQRCRNLRYLWVERDQVTPGDRELVGTLLPRGPWQMRLDELEQTLGGAPARQTVLRLLAGGLAHIDLDSPIWEGSIVSATPVEAGGEAWLSSL